MEPLFCIRMVLDDSVLREYAARNLQADSDGFKRMKFKMAGFLIALLVIGILTRDPGRTLLTGGIAVAALIALERKQRSQKGRREEFERQVNWMKQHLAPGELGSETVYCFWEQEMTWENERSRGEVGLFFYPKRGGDGTGIFRNCGEGQTALFLENCFYSRRLSGVPGIFGAEKFWRCPGWEVKEKRPLLRLREHLGWATPQRRNRWIGLRRCDGRYTWFRRCDWRNT